MIDLRSDTVTRPSQEMLGAMMNAKVGDDVFGDDPTVLLLEKKLAQMFGYQAGLFCPSGTMANQIAIKMHTQPMDEVICEWGAHIYQYEVGGIGFISNASVKPLKGIRGKLSLEQIKASLNIENVHKSRNTLIAIENSANKAGGLCYTLDEMQAIGDFAKSAGIAYHLDGARVFNALTFLNLSPSSLAPMFDSISVCLSKGLGCPVGSVLLGKQDWIEEARRVRKVLGGGMRQAGYLAAAGIFAIDNNVERLNLDHKNAKALQQCLVEKSWVEKCYDVETNIVIFQLSQNFKESRFLPLLEEKGILAAGMMNDRLYRFVTHLDISEEDVKKVIQVLNRI